MIDPNKVIDDAQHLLKKAVNVLEEEIAAGILAAKNIEKKVLNVDEVRDTNPEELMSRIRRDTHDAVDILLDAFSALTSHFGLLAETLKTKTAPVGQNKDNGANGNGAKDSAANGNAARDNGAGPTNGTQQKTTPDTPVVRTEKPAKPGTTIEVPIVLSNDSKDQSIMVALNRSELIGPGGNKIPAKFIKLVPRSFTMEPLQKKEVVIKINIPDTCKEGIYSSLVRDENNPDIRVILTVDIEQIEV
jgi:hypothetical protein